MKPSYCQFFANTDCMHLITIENDFLSLAVTENGAEIRHLQTKKDKTEWMWQADPAFWPRTAPVLFPIVGRLAEDQYFIDGHPYPMSQHGFARDRVFKVESILPHEIRFMLSSDYESGKFYPFDFDFLVDYNLEKNWVWISYEVRNKGEQPMYFSLGGHPGFTLPGWPETNYYLEFEKEEDLRPRLLDHGLLKKGTGPTLQTTDRQALIHPQLFDQDALVFENMKSKWVGFRSENDDHNLRLHCEGFPFFGIWSKPGAPFVCLEPWHGHADPVGSSGEISRKPAILRLEPGQNFQCRYAVEVRNY